MSIVGCTIIAKNYLAQARVLAKSFKEHHPHSPFYVLLIDEQDDAFDPSKEGFTTVFVKDLHIPNFEILAFRYGVLELATAVKPFFLAHLFSEYAANKVIYFDPDILLLQPLTELSAVLDAHAIVLNPHCTAPITDEKLPSERTILLCGAYNLGFIALRKSEVTDRMLQWWQERLTKYCLVRVQDGLFVDQKWMDLCPGMFGDVHLLREPQWNVAFWNLHERTVEETAGVFTANGIPIVFAHFSGYDPEKPHKVSQHQTRIQLHDQPGLPALFNHYRELLLQAGYTECSTWKYSYATFENGAPISHHIRLFFQTTDDGRQFTHPFSTDAHSFFAWLQKPRAKHASGAFLTNFQYEIYKSRPDIVGAYPNVQDADMPAFANWFFHPTQLHAYALAHPFTDSLVPLRPPQLEPHGLFYRWSAFLQRRHAWEWYQKCTRAFKRIIGKDRFYTLASALKGVQKSSPTPLAPPPVVEHVGVNLAGHLLGELGIGEGLRGHVHALQSAHIPFVLNNTQYVQSRQGDSTFAHLVKDENPYDINMIVENADMLPAFLAHKGFPYTRGKYTIGYWAWELSRFPSEWKDRFRMVQEVWVGSTFIKNALEPVSPVPVLYMPYVVQLPEFAPLSRTHFGVPEERFLFSFVFDYFSVFERKNPLGLVEAFQNAFSPQEPVSLLIKCINAEKFPTEHAALQKAMQGVSGCILEGYRSRAETLALIQSSNAYVSLHKSEGFGLTLAEAMAIGTPAIGTAYSGNTDFMNEKNSYLVPYSLTRLERTYGPYEAGNEWAEPNMDAAARILRHVYEHPEETAQRALVAKNYIQQNHNAENIGKRMAERLEAIATFA